MSSTAELVKRQRRATTFTLAHPEYADKHVGGVNVVEVDGHGRGDGHTVFTGGRDGTVRSWDLSSGMPRCARTFEGHAAWVNDVKRIDGAHLASASSDRSVKLWNTSQGTLSATLYGHMDYVMALARGADAGANALASGGLNKELFVWDIERGIATNASPSMTLYANTYATPLSGSKDSIYALDVSADGNVLVSGGTELALRVWDTRTKMKEGKLKGHTDTVRAIVVDADGKKCVTASSDRTIRVWDIGQQRCVQTFAGMHAGSIWAVDVNREFTRVYSSGVDRRLCVTSLTTSRSTLLCLESAAVLNITLDDTHRRGTSDGDIWTATASRSIKRWPANAPDDVAYSGSDATSTSARHTTIPTMTGSVSRQPGTWFDVGSPGVMSLGTPRKFDTWGDADPATPGSIAIGTGALSLAARTNAAASSSSSKAESASALAPLNEIVGASPVERYAVLRDKRRVMAQNSVGAITIVDVCTGKTIETLDGMENSSDFDALLEDQSINPLAAMPSWFTCDARSGSLAITLAPSSAFSAEAYANDLGIADAPDDERRNLGLEVIKTLLASWVSKYAPEKKSSASAFAPFPTSLEFDADYGRVSVNVDALRGTEQEREFLPKWIVDHALGVAPPPESPKLSFELKPVAGASTPQISNASVSAPKILGVRKIKEYVKEKLIAAAAASNDDDKNDKNDDKDGRYANLKLECAGVALDDGFTLAYIHAFVWKKGAPLLIDYRDVDDDVDVDS